MAKIRIGFGTELNIGSELSGIGTDNPTNTKQVLGNIHATNTKAIGISTLATYQGFLDKEAKISNNIDINSQAGTLGEIVIDGDITVSSGSTLCSGVDELTLTDSFSVPTGNTDSRIHCQTAGSMRFNEDLGTLEFYTGDEWRTVNSYNRGSAAGRAVIGRSYTPSSPNGDTRMEYVNISSFGNSIRFGDLTVARYFFNANSSSIRGIFGGGDPGPSNSDVIDYITITSEGNAIDFGNLLAAGRCFAGASSSTRGLNFSEGSTPGGTNVISYSEIATLGNALDFGDLTSQNGNKGTATSSPTRYVFHTQNNSKATIDFGSIASKGNSTRFGNYISGGPGHPAAALLRCCSNQTRAVFAGGYLLLSPYGFVTSQMGAITIASEGNATVFGDLTVARYGMNATSNQVRGIFAGGQGGNPYPWIDTIDYITFASSGNAQDFGDINASVGDAVSDSHGGLGGF